ncbi:MAG: single-stranded DNA-binding protein [Propionibacteriales bacterium]|nr:single-stranded DNA-binding protein [Propionibacteriales bacterium]
MLQTTVTFEGNIAADIDVAVTPSGKQVVRFPVLVNRRRRDPDTGEWTDDEPTRHSCTAFGSLGEHIAGSLGKGDRVLIVGNLVTDSWADKNTGEMRTAQRVLIDAAGPSLRWATASMRKMQRTTGAVAETE